MTNPIWVVKVRLFTTQRGSSQAYRGLWGTSIEPGHVPSISIHLISRLHPCLPLYQMVLLECIVKKGFTVYIEGPRLRYLAYQMAQYSSWRMNS